MNTIKNTLFVILLFSVVIMGCATPSSNYNKKEVITMEKLIPTEIECVFMIEKDGEIWR